MQSNSWTANSKRAWFITHLYKTAVEANPEFNHTLIDFGRKLEENHEYLHVRQFEGDQVPPELELTDMNIDIEESEDEIDWDSDNDNELSSDNKNESL